MINPAQQVEPDPRRFSRQDTSLPSLENIQLIEEPTTVPEVRVESLFGKLKVSDGSQKQDSDNEEAKEAQR